MSNSLRVLPPSFVPDWFVNDYQEHLEGLDDNLSDAEREYLVRSSKNCLRALVKYMKKNDYVFATRDEQGTDQA